MKNLIVLITSIVLFNSMIIAQSVNEQKVIEIKTEQETSTIINNIFSDIQKVEPSMEINSRENEKIAVDQIIVGKKVLITILSDTGLKTKKLTSFSQLVELIEKMRGQANLVYPKIDTIYKIKDEDNNDIILAISEVDTPSSVKKYL